MKKIILVCSLLYSVAMHSQGWVSPSSTSLVPVNNLLALTPLDIGIGTNAPSTQLHTTGGVRFQGLTTDNSLANLIVVDAQNNLFTRSFSSLLSSGGPFGP